MTKNTSPSPGTVILNWWKESLGERSSAAAKGLSARLRRASGVQALAELPVHELARRLGLQPTERDAASLIRLGIVLAWVREHDESATLPERLGRGEPPAMSQLRFQRLMRAEGDDLITALRRALAMTKYRCNVAALGTDLLRWGDDARTRWAFHYFGAQIPTPVLDTPEAKETAL